MKPRGTRSRLAQRPKDDQRCHRRLKDQDQEKPQQRWPTVMAERDGQWVGCLSTILHQQALIAGPWAVATKRPLVTAMRLIEADEKDSGWPGGGLWLRPRRGSAPVIITRCRNVVLRRSYHR
jgi:hypothetical protein